MVLYILKADSLLPAVIEKQGDYGEVYISRLRAAGYKEEAKVFDVVNQQYPEQVTKDDAILISGSKLNSWESDEWILKLIDFIRINVGKLPMFGVCFGHQIIARALGAKVGPSNKGWEASAEPVEPTPVAKQLFPELGDSPTFMHMHKDQVFEVPNDTELLFKTDITPVQGFYRPKDILTVQFHPEFDEEIVTIICNNRFEGEFQADCLARASKPQDGLKLFAYVAKFLNREL